MIKKKVQRLIDNMFRFKYNPAMSAEMKTYVITFDVAADRTRELIRDYLKSTYSTYCPIHKYCWAIVTADPAVKIRDKLSGFLNADDRLFIVRSGTEAAWRNSYGEDHNKWLKKNL